MSVTQHVLIETEDGSFTCHDSETGELYHNRSGAYTEALKNYVEPSGMDETLSKQGELVLLDACFGLGYNSWVLLEAALKHLPGWSRITIIAVEKEKSIISLVPKVLGDARFRSVKELFLANGYTNLSCLEFGTTVFKCGQSSTVVFKLHEADLREFVRDLNEPVDIVFHDPFSAKRVPELWTIELFLSYRRLLDLKRGRLLTYSAACAIRGGLLDVGFNVYRTQAVGGKSGGTLASISRLVPDDELVFRLSNEELSRIASIAGTPYRDPTLSSERKRIFKLRQEEQLARRLALA